MEYADHESPSISVKFALPDAAKALPSLAGKNVSIVIWTTTPWTLVSNLAVALHPALDYVAFEDASSGQVLIVAEALLAQSLQKFGIGDHKVVEKFKGGKLEGLKARHPFLDRESLVILGEHVTLESGTGAVHTAPGHGQEDYEVGLKYGLEVYAPVDQKARFTKEAGSSSARTCTRRTRA